MRRDGAVLGGEQSGHIVHLGPRHDRRRPADGAAVWRPWCTAAVAGLAELLAPFRRFPQVLVNVPVARKPDLATLPASSPPPRVSRATLGADGRLVLRYSGTEPLARVMIEGPEQAEIERLAEELAAAIRAEIGADGGQRHDHSVGQRRPRRHPAPGARRRLPGPGGGRPARRGAPAPSASRSTCAATAATSRTATSPRCVRAVARQAQPGDGRHRRDARHRPRAPPRPGHPGARAAGGGHDRGRPRPGRAARAGGRGGRPPDGGGHRRVALRRSRPAAARPAGGAPRARSPAASRSTPTATPRRERRAADRAHPTAVAADGAAARTAGSTPATA